MNKNIVAFTAAGIKQLVDIHIIAQIISRINDFSLNLLKYIHLFILF